MMTTKITWKRPLIDFVDPRKLPYAELRSRGDLPHLYKEGGSYFVTFRLWDAVEPDCGAGVPPADSELAGGTPAPQGFECGTPVPQGSTQKATVTQRWNEIQQEFNDEKVWKDLDLARRLAETPEPPLTAGSCVLRRDDIATVVEHALLHFRDQRYQLMAWCVMPNYVHVAYTALGEHTPEDIHHSWKSFTSHQINRILDRSGILWERESFDHLIRSIEHYETFIDYIEQNPVNAGLCLEAKNWKFNSASRFG